MAERNDQLAATNPDSEMLAFLLEQFQMDSQSSWRFLNDCWPMIHAKGETARKAIQAAMAEVERDKRERDLLSVATWIRVRLGDDPEAIEAERKLIALAGVPDEASTN